MRMRRACCLVALLAVIAAPAAAQPAGSGPGFTLRAGATMDPDQFHLGFHMDVGELAPRLVFRPGAEIGFGSSRTILVANFDALYRAHESRTLEVLVGGGVGAGAEWPDGRDTRGLFGVNLVAALEWGTRPTPHVPQARGSQLRYLFELRAGLGDLPGFKATLGLRF